jgi:hypothetical protein
MLNRTFKKLALAGLTAALVAPAGAAARPALEGQSVAAGGGPGVTPQAVYSPDPCGMPCFDVASGTAPTISATDLRAPDQVGGGVTATTQDLRAPDQVSAPAPSQPASSSDDGIDSAWLFGLGGAALVSLAGLASAFLIRSRRHATA